MNQPQVHVCPLSPEPPPYPSIPSHPSRLSQSTRLSSLCYTRHSHWLSILYMAAYTCQCYSLNSSHSLLPWLCFKFVLYVYVSILVLQIGSSVPFFQISYICVNYDICFCLSDLLCVTSSRFIHLTVSVSHSFLSMAE